MADPVTPTAAVEIYGSDRMWGLKELPLPDPVAWTPQTLGWLIVALVLLGVAIWYLWQLWQRYQSRAYSREGLKKLAQMKSDPSMLSDLPFLLRKSALQAAQRGDVAALRGADWAAWLNASAGSALFDIGDVDALDLLAYGPSRADAITPDQRNGLIEKSQTWMRTHRVSV